MFRHVSIRRVSLHKSIEYNTGLTTFVSRGLQSADGMACELVLSAQGAVSALCIDQLNGCVVAGVQEFIR